MSFADDEPPLPIGLSQEDSKSSEEPALPMGLESSESDEPELPMGLEPSKEEASDEPALPEGLFSDSKDTQESESAEKPEFDIPFGLTGFWEARGGLRTRSDPYEKDESIGETRLQLEFEKDLDFASFKLTSDFLYDPVFDRHVIELEEGKGWIDLREANVSMTPLSFMDLKLGRQILTWGTGDMIFINDLFPKDWNSFFIGRDDEYLKAPSDAGKISFYTDIVNMNIVFTPRFDSDRFIDGRRISYWNGNMLSIAGQNATVDVDKPDDWMDDYEIAVRLFKNISGYELALYGYWGFWKSPGGSDPMTGEAIFPDLAVYGGSIRTNIGKGIGNLEVGYYDSKDDNEGDDPFIKNDEFRFLIGYEQEIAKELTAAFQYYVEYMLDYDDYADTWFKGVPKTDEFRHVFTLRLTKLLMSQNLKLTLFTYYSPSDDDAYIRPNAHYKINDNWSAEIGGNFFVGNYDHTFFGQFERNSNFYVGARYSF